MEKGGVKTLVNMIDGIKTLNANNLQMIQQIENSISEEEKDDEANRLKYGQKWNRLQSVALNQKIKQEVQYYKAKFQQAGAADAQVFHKFELQKDGIAILEKSREVLTAEMPQAGECLSLQNQPLLNFFKNICARFIELN